MNHSIVRIADVDAELLDLDELVKPHLRLDVDFTADDDYIAGLITAARSAIESEINHPVGEQTFELGLQQWAPVIEFPRPPLRSILSIKYRTIDGVLKVLEDFEASPEVPSCGLYVLETAALPGAIFLHQYNYWPFDILGAGYPIKIRFKAGIVDLPQALRQAMLLTIGHLYENREAAVVGVIGQIPVELPLGVADLCAPWKYMEYC